MAAYPLAPTHEKLWFYENFSKRFAKAVIYMPHSRQHCATISALPIKHYSIAAGLSWLPHR
jgi:hypothetical protein